MMLRLFIADVSALCPESVVLPPERAEKLRKLTRIEDRRLSAGVYLLLCRACDMLGIPREYSVGENGKPDFTGGGLHFSLAHSGKYALCAVADSAVGADIEMPRAGSQRIAERFFSPDEAAHVTTAEDLCRLWTMKESYIKARGLNLSALSDFSVLKSEGFSYLCRKHDGYCIAVCAEGVVPENTEPEVVCLC